MSEETSARGQSGLERMLLHIVQAITVAGIIGGYVALGQLQTSNAVTQVEIRALTARIDDIRAAAADRYTGTMARHELAPLREKTADHEARLRQIERRVLGADRQ